MSFLLPGFLAAAVGIAAAVTLLHFIVTREPDLFRLPTARFAPERAIQARSRALEPSDLLLLAIRVALVLAVGAALARPVISPERRDLIRIVLLDRSRGIASAGESADSARTVLGEQDILILFDSSATVVTDGVADTLARLSRTDRQGSVSTALVSALRTASRIRDRADSLELVVVSPLVVEEVDAATDSIRSLWPSGIRFIRTAARSDSAPPIVSFEGPPDDPLRLAVPGAVATAGAPRIRILRGLAAAADSAWAAGDARALVVWPASHEVPAGWSLRAADSIGAVTTGTAVVVAPFVRRVSLAGNAAAVGQRVVARWVDGDPAGVEVPHGQGCIRTVTVDVPAAGDLVLDSRFAGLVAALVGPCGGPMSLALLSDDSRIRLAGPPGVQRASSAGFPIPEQISSRWGAWFLAGAIALAALELAVRRRIPR